MQQDTGNDIERAFHAKSGSRTTDTGISVRAACGFFLYGSILYQTGTLCLKRVQGHTEACVQRL